MTNLEIIRSDFEEFIRLDPSVPEGLRNSLRLTERVPAFVDNLAKEIAMVERRGIKLDRLKIKELVYSLSAFFVHNLRTKADQMHMSDLAKTAIRTKTEGDELIQKMDDQGNADLSEELGIVIQDKGNDGKRGPTS